MSKWSARMAEILFVVCVLGSWTSFAAPPDVSPYPLEVGAKWVYEAGALQLEEEVTSFEMVDGERCARVETRINGQVVAYEHLAVRPDGIYRVSIAGERVEPPLCFLKYPAAMGSRWDVSSKVNGVAIAGQFTLGKTTLRVPAGEYHALTVRGTKFESEAGPLEFTYYFAPGVGKVKQIISTKGKSVELALKEYVPAH